MRWIHIAAAILFFISAALQYNDPDPLRWIAIYGAAGAACLVASHPRGRWLGAAVGLISLFWAASYAPRVLPDLAFGDLVKPMHEKTPQIEDGREMLGLLIIAVWMGVVALVGRGRGRGKPVAAVALLVLGSWAVSPPSIAADRETEGAEEPRRSGYVETATVQGRTIALEGVSTTVVEREELERFGAATVGELMRFVPGVDVVAAGGRAGLAYAHIRGGDPDFTVVMLDGVPLNDATDQLGGAVNLNALPADTVERIEVVRGPLSAVYGATGLAGAINIITRRGTTDAPALSASLETGDADLIHGAFSISRGGEDRDFFVGVTWDEEEGR
ncbi:MAG: TonB-dependent receptor plug domain-containing protein, partial [bacterium]|nr:TonB-dependent receptor plug domain-containing protein [bacterium]